MLLSIVFCSGVIPAQAAEYKITSANLNVLANQAQWAQYKSSPLQELMVYSKLLNTGTIKPSQFNIQSQVKSVGVIKALYIGECAVFVEATCPNIVRTDKWMKGRPICTVKNGKVVYDTSIAPGTVIATFIGAPGSKTYLGHTAIYGNPTSTGINVWDSNFVPPYSGLVARHCIPSTTAKTSGYNTNYANDYCVVNV